MDKILKFKKFFLLGLLTAAVGMFAISCTEAEDVTEEDGYTIRINNGTMTWNGSSLSSGSILYENDAVLILSATPPSGKVFDQWTANPSSANSKFANRNNSSTTFTMPDYDVTITATFKDGEPDGYTISVNGGTMEWWEDPVGDPNATETSPLQNGDLLYQDDVVIILSATAPAGQVFDKWNVTPSSAENRFDDRYDERTTFRMPAANVTITATFKALPLYEDGISKVRFTWEAAEAANITHISVDSADVAWWYDDVFGDPANVPEDFSDVPLYDGNPSLPSIKAPYTASNANKGKYFTTDAGNFTAVCGTEDEFGLAEIVANYTITVDPATSSADGADKYFEIAFDVGAFLDGEDDLGWFDDEYDNPNTDPRLEKKKGPKFGIKKVKTEKVKKSGVTFDVTYYVIRRPKN